jgi:hypothetical protein
MDHGGLQKGQVPSHLLRRICRPPPPFCHWPPKMPLWPEFHPFGHPPCPSPFQIPFIFVPSSRSFPSTLLVLSFQPSLALPFPAWQKPHCFSFFGVDFPAAVIFHEFCVQPFHYSSIYFAAFLFHFITFSAKILQTQKRQLATRRRTFCHSLKLKTSQNFHLKPPFLQHFYLLIF